MANLLYGSISDRSILRRRTHGPSFESRYYSPSIAPVDSDTRPDTQSGGRSTKLRSVRRGIAAVLMAVTNAACMAEPPEAQPAEATYEYCDFPGNQSVVIRQGDTFQGMIRDNVENWREARFEAHYDDIN